MAAGGPGQSFGGEGSDEVVDGPGDDDIVVDGDQGSDDDHAHANT